MDTPDTSQWIDLRHFEDGELAHDVTTALLAMEFEASLVDLSDGSIIAGIGSMVDPDSPQAKGPFVLAPRGRVPTTPRLKHLSVPAYEPIESREASRTRRTEGGPWSLRVPPETQVDLHEVLETIIEERNSFEDRIERKHVLDRRIMQVSFGVVGGLVALYFLLMLLKVVP